MAKEKVEGNDVTLVKDPTLKVNPRFEPVFTEKPFTPYVSVEEHEDGTSSVVITTLEQLDDPLAHLTVSDFKIKKLLQAGVKLHHIDVGQINHKIGVSSEQVAAFNARLDSLRSEIFVEPEN